LARPADDSFTIRVRNLNEDCREADLQELFSPFGALQRVFVAKDRQDRAKGFAFVNYYSKYGASA
jgi:translation initiation factor 3 subunit G